MIDKLYFLPVGKLSLDHSALNQNLLPGQMVTIQIWSYLFITKNGPLLLDTGMPESFINNPDYFKGTPFEGQFIPLMEPEDHIVAVLKKIGYSPSDIIAIINSHLHMDHAGTIPIFQTPQYIFNRRNGKQLLAHLSMPRLNVCSRI